MELRILDGNYSIHRLNPSQEIPACVLNSEFFNISRTDEELSIVCSSEVEIKSEQCDSDWSCIKVPGPVDFGLTGIFAKISDILARSNISIFAISTYDTDYILVKTYKINEAISALKKSGYKFR